MAGQTPTGSSSDGVAFLVSAGIVYEIVAAACSSPQTTEINADTRSETLFKWVYLGLGQAAVFVAAAALIDKPHRAAIITGGVAAGVIMYGSYWHARRAGLASSEPGTEGQDETPWMLKKD
jgi:protein-S-isoprenylcysteine O-methyltransferase Ste14